MTDSSAGVIIKLRNWLVHHPYLLPLAILVVGAAFRFYNLNWDQDHLLHPDERWIYMVVSGANGNSGIAWPTSVAQFLDVREPNGGSPLNPHFFAYGSLPFYLLALLAGAVSFLGQHVPFLSQWAGIDSYSGLPMLGRGLSACLDLLSLVILFFLARRVFGYWTAVLTMALGALTVLDIQLSHFYAVDTVLLPLSLLTLLAAVEIAQTGSRWAYIWGGMAFGAALATKTTALLLVIPLAAAAILNARDSAPFPVSGPPLQRLANHYRAVRERLNQNLFSVLGTFVVAAVAFAVLEPYGVLDRATLVKNLAEQQTYLVTNNPPFAVPFTIQYAHTVPYLFQLQNMLFWTLGIPLALAAFAGVIFVAVRNANVRFRSDQVVLLLWVIPYFLFVGSFFAKFNRYMLPITPVMTLFGAAFLVWLVRRKRPQFRVLGWAAVVAVTLLSFLYSLAYMNIYEQPNTRVEASQWIYRHIPPGSTIGIDTAWDDELPLDLNGQSGSIYSHRLHIELYNPDNQQKIADITRLLAHSNYIIMSSERIIASIPRLPDRYPITTRYYQLLNSGQLNFRLIKVFQAHPQLGPFIVHDYPADESFHVYDHPIVRIWKRTGPMAPAHLAALLTSTPAAAQAAGVAVALQPARIQPDTRLMLTAKQWAADQQGPTLDQMFPPAGFAMQHPILVWILVLELLGILAFPFVFLAFGKLIDRGFVIAKTIGLLILGYVVWILVSLGVATYDRGIIALVLLLFAMASAGTGYLLRRRIAAFLRLEWRAVLAGEAVFLAGFVLFVLLRMWYPDLGHQFSSVTAANLGEGRMGEKQMELAFINAIVRSRVFPPYDPFFGHGYINYYYYGFFLVGTLCKLTQIVPATGFNLAVATFFAMLVANIFSVGLNLTRRIGPGIVAAAFVGVLGNLNGGWQAVQDLMTVGTVHSSVPLLGGILDAASGVVQVLTNHAAMPPFDFWGPTRIVPPVGGPITEFPYFTYLFADLHPHLMAYPMTAAALALGVNFLRGEEGPLRRLLPSIAVGAMLVGAIAATNPWDYPTYLAVIGIGAFMGAFSLRRRIGLREVGTPLAVLTALAALSFLLYLPFKRGYQTVFATGIGLTRDITPRLLTSTGVPANQVHDALVTPLHIYLEHFGLFLFAILSYLALLLLLNAGLGRRLRRTLIFLQFAAYYRDRLPLVWRASRVVRRRRVREQPVLDYSLFLGLGILVVGLLVLQYFLLAFLTAVLGLTILLALRLARQLPPAQLFVLVLLLIPLGLSILTQIFFVKDWLAEGSDFRMNTIFKFYNQAWVLYAVAAAVALYYFMADQIAQRSGRSSTSDGGSTAVLSTESAPGRPVTSASPPPSVAFSAAVPAIVTSDSRHRQAGGFGAVAAQDIGPIAAGASPVRRGRMSRPERLSRSGPITFRPLELAERRPLWTGCLVLLMLASLVYTYAGTVSRETYRTTWLPENSVPFTLDGMAFMKVTYPHDYAAISWLNAHVHGAQVIAEAGESYYNWRSRVSMFTGLPTIVNGIHEGEQRYDDELNPNDLCGATRNSDSCLRTTHPRADDLKTLYSSPLAGPAWRVIRLYGVRWIYVGFSERQLYPATGLAKFQTMVGHGLSVAFRSGDTVIYRVTRP